MNKNIKHTSPGRFSSSGPAAAAAAVGAPAADVFLCRQRMTLLCTIKKKNSVAFLYYADQSISTTAGVKEWCCDYKQLNKRGALVLLAF
jgi:hypothetical protein